MGFFLELKLLLWKNFTLKRRKPIMLIFELLIPLVLFVVLVLIRRRRPAVENPASYYFARPLPSAGLMGVMQAFCESPPIIDEYGFPNNPNSTILDFLTHINTVAENYNFFEPGFTLDELQEVPKMYRSIVEDPLMMKEYFEQNDTGISSVSLLKDPNGLVIFMTRNLSFDEQVSKELVFNTSVQRKSLFNLLFHNPNISHIFPVDVNQTPSKTSQNNNVSISETLLQNMNLKMEEGLLYTYLRQHDISQEILSLLLGNNSDYLQELSNFIRDVLLDEPAVSQQICVPRQDQNVHVMNCDATISKERCREDLRKLTEDYCNLSRAKKKELFTVLSQHVDVNRIKDFFENWNRNEGKQRMARFTKNVETVLKFKLTVRDLFRVSEVMPKEYCDNENTTNGLGYEDTDSDPDTLHAMDNLEISNSTAEMTRRKKNRSGSLLNVWKAMQKTVCGHDVIMNEVRENSPQKDFVDFEEIPMSQSHRAKLKMLTHTLYRNPKLLYVPSGTAASKIIQEANRTFAFFDTVTNYATTLSNVSEEIKAFLALNTTENNLLIIRKIQQDMLNSPLKKWFIASGVLQDFLEDKEITDKQTFINQLDAIGITACSWKYLMRGISFNVFRGFRTEDEMIDFVKNKAPNLNLTVLAGVVFYMNDDGSLPNHMIYKIRQNASYVRNTQNVRNPVWFPGPGDDPSVYYELGFLWIQDILERAMINLYSGRDVIEPGTYIHHMPYPCYISDQFIFMIDHVLALCLTVSWVYSVAMLVQHIVYEKEQRLKEVMKMMGMRNSIHWIAWFISSFAQMTVTIMILTIILKYGKVLAYSNPWIIFLTMEIFAVSIIMFSFLVSVLFSKAKIAAACAGILYFMSYVPYLYIMVREEGAHEIVSTQYKLSASFLAPTALGLAVKYFSFYEEIGQGMHWSNIDKPPSETQGCNLLYILGMLLLDSLLYLVLFWYIENVHPGAFGIPKPWNFPFTKSYWLGIAEEPLSPAIRRHPFRTFMLRNAWWNGSQRTPFLTPNIPSVEHQNLDPENEWKNTCEDEPTHLPLGVSISKLCKKYKNASKFAVHNLNLNLYEGQITALLGPTGSGKTTLMSILTGLYPPTTGSATIYGQDIGTRMEAIRSSLGLCPQHNVLFDDLTVAEHIWFYSRLKHGNNDVETEAEKLIMDLDLPHKRHQKVDCLSGGMKRRLSVAIAFVGGSKAVFMDEPTAGVDPVARRAIWDLIIKYKKGRTILLSTHHMDEADILGDRIAIIENGTIKCCGSPLYLKHHLGEGYHLFIVKKRNESEFTSNCIQQTVTSFIRRRSPSVRFVKESKHELHYMLALADLKAGNFVRLFKDLEKSKSELHISSYGVKNTTLEEIFMKVIAERRDSESDVCPTESNEHVELNDTVNLECIKLENVAEGACSSTGTGNVDSTAISTDMTKQRNETNMNTSVSTLQTPTAQGDGMQPADQETFIPDSVRSLDRTIDDPTLTPKYPVWQQFCAILKKRYLCTKRNLEGLISQILLPSFFVSVAMSVALTAEVMPDLPELILSTAQFYKLNHLDENVIGLANNKLDLLGDSEILRMSNDAVSSDIASTLTLPSGPGAQCVLKSPHVLPNFVKEHYTPSFLREDFFDSMCSDVFQHGIPFSLGKLDKFDKQFIHTELNNSQTSKERNYPICYCAEEKTSFVCPHYGFSEPPFFRTVTGDIIYNISGQNESQYYLYTSDRFRLRRFGGLSLGLVRNYVPKRFGNKSRSLFGKIAVRGAAKVWYDENGYHSVSTYLNVMNNAILRANLPKGVGSPAGYGITVINHPWPNTHAFVLSTAARDILQGNEVLISIFIIVAMSFVPASFALFVVYERYTRSSHLQLLSGVHPMTYLFANYIWDVCNYFVPASFIVAILLIFDVPAYSSRENLPAVIVLFLMYGWCISPVMHCTSLIFNEPSSAYIFLIVINLFVGVTCIVTSFLLEVFSSDDIVIIQMHNILRTLFMVFPNYCLGRGLMDIAIWHYYYSMYLEYTVWTFMIGQESQVKSPFSWNGTGKCLSAMVGTGLTFFIINFLIESKRLTRTRGHSKFLQKVSRSINSTDEDVSNERIRVLRGLANNDILRVENLTKVYHTTKMGEHLAVDRLCFGVPPGECFGLLGVNSAGKSSTFKMLTGDTPITFGDAFINTSSVKNSPRVALKSIGYCPQVDALLDELTAREHLQLYARLRGVPSKEVDKVAEWALRKLDLLQFADRPCRTYSGGNRRKISTAIALIGSPSLIFLDEPTSGTDPRSRRFLWDLILTLVKEGRSIVFTSHSMEECEMLCTRLAIMVQGQFRCIGSTQHLKNKFGDGYSLTLRCNLEKDTGKVERYMKRVFPFAVLKEKHHNSLHYEIASQHVSLDDMFQKMEVAVKDMPILDYSVSQNTLDNVFINFVKSHLLTTSNAGDTSSASTDTAKECTTQDVENTTNDNVI